MTKWFGGERLAEAVVQRIRAGQIRRRAPGLRRGANVRIDPHARVIGKVCIGEESRIDFGALVNAYGGRIEIGRRSSIGPYCVLYGHGGLTLGDDVLIAAHTVIVPSTHNYRDTTRTIREQGTSERPIHIEDDVWIGTHCAILTDVTIGTGSIIAAGAVVRDDVAPGSIIGGVPGRVIGRR